MKRMAVMIVVTWVALVPAFAQAGKTTYVYSDRRFNFVKRVELNKKERKEKEPTHPYTFTEPQLRHVLANIRLSKRLVLSKEVADQKAFDESALHFLTPKLMQAFDEAKSNEKIAVSYLEKKPLVILRNDLITIMELWVSGDDLHIYFAKLKAKLFGDTDKKGNETKAVNEAKGIRVSLETDATQELGNSSEELIVHLSKSFADLEAKAKVQLKPLDAAETTMAASPPVIKLSQEDAEKRLKKLEKLKKKKLITEEEYKEKRGEVLDSL